MPKDDPTVTKRRTQNSQQAAAAAAAASASSAVSRSSSPSLSSVSSATADLSAPSSPLSVRSSAHTMSAPPFGLTADQWTNVQQLISTAVTSAVSASATARPRRPDVNPPAEYDGSDPAVTLEFLDQCELVFRTRAADYPDSEARVNYCASFLRGAAHRWFMPYISAPPRSPSPGGTPAPTVLNSWSEFRAEFIRSFGKSDVKKSAAIQITTIAMSDHHHVLKYSIDFASLTTYLPDWSDAALKAQYYRGLAPRIKDDLSKVADPATYAALVTLSRSIDQRYWDRKAELTAETRKPAPRALPVPPAALTSPSASSSAISADLRIKRSSSPSPALSGILGPDGRLTAAEKQRRRELNLCLFCGSDDHLRDGCPTAPPRSTPARAASTAPTSAHSAAKST